MCYAGCMAFPPAVAESLRAAKQIYVATRRADGAESKVVPVWFMFDGDAVYFTTAPESHKARRLAPGRVVTHRHLAARDGEQRLAHQRPAPAACHRELVRRPSVRAGGGERL